MEAKLQIQLILRSCDNEIMREGELLRRESCAKCAYIIYCLYFTYAAILAFPETFLLPLAFGSTFTFKLSAVDDVVWNSREGPRGAVDAARVVREEAPVENAEALSMMATTRKTAAMNLFMVDVVQ